MADRCRINSKEEVYASNPVGSTLYILGQDENYSLSIRSYSGADLSFLGSVPWAGPAYIGGYQNLAIGHGWIYGLYTNFGSWSGARVVRVDPTTGISQNLEYALNGSGSDTAILYDEGPDTFVVIAFTTATNGASPVGATLYATRFSKITGLILESAGPFPNQTGQYQPFAKMFVGPDDRIYVTDWYNPIFQGIDKDFTSIATTGIAMDHVGYLYGTHVVDYDASTVTCYGDTSILNKVVYSYSGGVWSSGPVLTLDPEVTGGYMIADGGPINGTYWPNSFNLYVRGRYFFALGASTNTAGKETPEIIEIDPVDLTYVASSPYPEIPDGGSNDEWNVYSFGATWD